MQDITFKRAGLFGKKSVTVHSLQDSDPFSIADGLWDSRSYDVIFTPRVERRGLPLDVSQFVIAGLPDMTTAAQVSVALNTYVLSFKASAYRLIELFRNDGAISCLAGTKELEELKRVLNLKDAPEVALPIKSQWEEIGSLLRCKSPGNLWYFYTNSWWLRRAPEYIVHKPVIRSRSATKNYDIYGVSKFSGEALGLFYSELVDALGIVERLGSTEFLATYPNEFVLAEWVLAEQDKCKRRFPKHIVKAIWP